MNKVLILSGFYFFSAIFSPCALALDTPQVMTGMVRSVEAKASNSIFDEQVNEYYQKALNSQLLSNACESLPYAHNQVIVQPNIDSNKQPEVTSDRVKQQRMKKAIVLAFEKNDVKAVSRFVPLLSKESVGSLFKHYFNLRDYKRAIFVLRGTSYSILRKVFLKLNKEKRLDIIQYIARISPQSFRDRVFKACKDLFFVARLFAPYVSPVVIHDVFDKALIPNPILIYDLMEYVSNESLRKTYFGFKRTEESEGWGFYNPAIEAFEWEFRNRISGLKFKTHRQKKESLENILAVFDSWKDGSSEKKALDAKLIAFLFPKLKEHAQKIVTIFSYFRDKLKFVCGHDSFEGLPFRMCSCELSTRSKRLLLVLMQLNYFIAHFKPTDRIVHTAFAESSLLQTWLLAYSLIILGYDNLHINVVGPDIFDKITFVDSRNIPFIEDHADYVEILFKSFLPNSQKVNVKAYGYGYEYVRDVNAPKSDSFDMVDPGADIDVRGPVNPEDFDNYSKMILHKQELDSDFTSIRYSKPFITFYFSSKRFVQVACKLKAIYPGVDVDFEPFCQDLQQLKFRTRREAIQWIHSSPLFNNFLKRVSSFFNQKCAFDYSFAHSCRKDFEEIVCVKRKDRSVVFTLEGNNIKVRHFAPKRIQ